MKDTQRIRTMTDAELREEVAAMARNQAQSSSVTDAIEAAATWLPWIKGIFVTTVIGAVGATIWVTTIEYRQQDLSENQRDHHAQLKEIHTWQTKTEANRFTSKDASEMMNNLMSAAATQDKRLQRVEDSNVVIKESLQRIEHSLKQ
jgi:hypothetical protein